MVRAWVLSRSVCYGGAVLLGSALLTSFPCAHAQGSATLGNGLSAAALARGGTNVTTRSGALDAVEGNPAGLAGISAPTLDLSAVALVAGGSFQNAVNRDARLTGLAGALPYGAFASPFGSNHWVASVALTPDILVRANWHYNDAPGTLGVTYGYKRQEDEIIAFQPSLGLARNFGTRWSAGATVGVALNHNDLHAPYIFQQQPALQGLKVLLALSTGGYGWNGSAGVQWQPTSYLRGGLAWKSGTTLHTHGEANGTASALFAALGVTADPAFHYHAGVMNHLPQAFSAGLSWQTPRHVTLALQGDFTAWGQAFQQLPMTFTAGTNSVLNAIVGANSLHDTAPLHWRNQGVFHAGMELPVSDAISVRGGYSWATNPVPASTLTPLTAAIMQSSIAGGGGWNHGRWQYDAAYQAQLPSTKTISTSGLKAGEYDNSRIRVWTQSVTITAEFKF